MAFHPDPGVTDPECANFTGRLEDRYSQGDLAPDHPTRQTRVDTVAYARWLSSYWIKRQQGMDHEQATQAVLEEIDAILHPRPAPAFVPESGAVSVNGTGFICNGQPWAWFGVSMFRLFGRFKAGENIQPTIDWIHACGFNVLRVFPQWREIGGLDDRCDKDPDFADRLAAFVDYLAAQGLRVELTAIANWTDPDSDRPTLRTIYDVAAGRWNVCVEGVNEPWNRGYDVLRLYQGVDRKGVLSAYGYKPDFDGSKWTILGALDYITSRSDRDLAHYPRDSKDLLDQKVVGKPIIDDEPLGVADYDQAGSGARSTDEDAHVGHHALSRIFCAGTTVHCECGLEGREPSANEPTTARIIAAIAAAVRFYPASSSLGSYSRNGLPDFPLTVDGSETYDGQGHAYATIAGQTAQVVIPKPTGAWSPHDANGWHVAATGPKPYLLRCER